MKPAKKLMLGISVRGPEVTPEQDEQTKALFAGKCDFCGVPIDQSMRHTHHHNGGWYNSCSLCYYYEHLDKIPSYDRGKFIYCHKLSQEELNIFLGLTWSMVYIERQFDVSEEFEENLQGLTDLEKDLEYRVEGIKSHFLVGSQKNVQSVNPDIVANYLNLLDDEKYHQRYKMFSQFLWLPPKTVFRQETAFWAKNAYNQMRDDNITQLMQGFVTTFGLEVSE